MSGPKSVLVTGSSTGIGAACAMRLAERGWRVFAGVRRDEDGRKLKAQTRDALEPVLLDVTRHDTVRTVAARLGEILGAGGLAGLVNNAGIAIGGPVEGVSLEDWRRQFDVNLFGAVAVTQTCLPLLRKARGRIVNISSVSGLLASPFLAPYAASKFALEAVSDALRVELRPQGVRVALIEPGAVATPIWDKSLPATREREAACGEEIRSLYGTQMERMHRMAEDAARRAMPVDKVVAAVVHALTARRPKTRYLLGRDARFATVASSLLPDTWWDALMAKHFR